MTKVIRLASRSAGIHAQNTAQSTTRATTAEMLTPERLAVIENCLCMSLHFVRQINATPADLWAATSRANRALTLLKQACEQATARQLPGRA